MIKATQEEIDLLADVLWWIKGYRADKECCSLHSGHEEAIIKARQILLKLNEEN